MAKPVELRVSKAERTLTVTFDDGARFVLPAEYLRVESPSAEVRGHAPDQKVLVWGKAEVGILKLELVGNYAVRIIFDDLHDSGIYSWDYLYELGRDHAARWARYLEELEAAGKSRHPRKVYRAADPSA